ncbi:hypothetical protein SUSAZ_04720 [Sulfolobus acidocaldarius SUSAZ]|nr:hypothetical protein SUSAZ_04720 [Sulfolobus acidocaldarius SUSAZ]
MPRKTYTVRKTFTCTSGYGLYECEGDKCKLVACVNSEPLASPLNHDIFSL